MAELALSELKAAKKKKKKRRIYHAWTQTKSVLFSNEEIFMLIEISICAILIKILRVPVVTSFFSIREFVLIP